MSQEETLQTKKAALYDKAERYWWWSLEVNVGTQLFLLMSVIINWSLINGLAGFVSFIAPLAVVILRELWSADTRKADKIRRLIHYANGLGEKISCADMACVSSYNLGIRCVEPHFTEPYYASDLTTGTKRLLDNTKESAFFTYNLAAKIKWKVFLAIVVIIFVVLAILYFAISPAIGAAARLTFTKSVAILITLLFAGDIVVICKKYMDLENEAREAYKCFEQMLRREDVTLSEAMQAVEDYNLSVLQGPPILFKEHIRHEKELNRLYRHDQDSKEDHHV